MQGIPGISSATTCLEKSFQRNKQMSDAYNHPIPRPVQVHKSPPSQSVRASLNTAGSKQGQSATVQEKKYQSTKGNSPTQDEKASLASPMRTSLHTKSSNVLPRQIRGNTHQPGTKAKSITGGRNVAREISITENDSKLTDKRELRINPDFINLQHNATIPETPAENAQTMTPGSVQ